MEKIKILVNVENLNIDAEYWTKEKLLSFVSDVFNIDRSRIAIDLN